MICLLWLLWLYLGLNSVPNLAIALLAVAAAIMTVRAELFSKAEQVVWVLIAFALFGIESRSIYQDRRENIEQQREEMGAQQVQFAGILRQNERDFKKTVADSDKIFTKTQTVAELARDNLLNVTGGSSFAYVYPSKMADGNSLVTLNVHNEGSQVLSFVVVTIYRIVIGSIYDSNGTGTAGVGPAATVDIGTLAPHEGRTVPGQVFVPVLGQNGVAEYRIYINAQNPGVHEDLFFRRSKSGNGWAFKLDAARQVKGKRTRGAVYDRKLKIWILHLKVIDWTEPT